MTDRQAFERMMELMGMEIANSKTTPDNKVIITYRDKEENSEQFTTQGYDEFRAGAIFDSQGKIIKGYLDSHVAYSSEYYCEIYDLLKSLEE